jgi:hypothetical protein
MAVRERMKKYRLRRRAAGLRMVQLWGPDPRSPVFAAKCRRQSVLMQHDPAEAETLECIGRVAAGRNDGVW